MPYISQEIRDDLYDLLEEVKDKICIKHHEDLDGVLNYVVTELVADCVDPTCNWKYKDIARAMAVFSCAQQEFYRRVASPKEDIAIHNNGDINAYKEWDRIALHTWDEKDSEDIIDDDYSDDDVITDEDIQIAIRSPESYVELLERARTAGIKDEIKKRLMGALYGSVVSDPVDEAIDNAAQCTVDYESKDEAFADYEKATWAVHCFYEDGPPTLEFFATAEEMKEFLDEEDYLFASGFDLTE